MLNVLIHEPDNYHRLGMSELLCDVFNVEYQEELAFSTIITPESVWNADIIILSLTRGESYTCKKELRYRNRGAFLELQILTLKYVEISHYAMMIFTSWNEDFRKLRFKMKLFMFGIIISMLRIIHVNILAINAIIRNFLFGKKG